MKLKETVKYFPFGDFVYLRDTAASKDYLYNEIVFDILQILSRNPGSSEEHICRCLSELYQIADYAAFQDDMTGFLRELQADGLLLPTPEATAEEPPDIAGNVQRYCEKHHRLFNVCLELTYRCNEHCIHCYLDEPEFGKELDFVAWRGILDELSELGCPNLLLTGGEVSLHPAFPDIAEYASRKGMLVNIYTNGYHLPEPLLDRLIALHPNSISFSFYGAEPAVHDLVTGIPGSFEKSLRTMMICKCAGIDTFIKTIALKQNVNGLEALFRLGQRLHIPVSLAKLVLPSINGTKQCEAFKLNSVSEYRKLFQLEAEYGHCCPQKRELVRNKFFCAAGLSSLSINPYGDVSPCSSLKTVFGNVRNEPLREIWDHSAAQLDQVLPKSPLLSHCTSCSYAEYCNVCPGALQIQDGVPQCNPDICTIAQGAYAFASAASH